VSIKTYLTLKFTWNVHDFILHLTWDLNLIEVCATHIMIILFRVLRYQAIRLSFLTLLSVVFFCLQPLNICGHIMVRVCHYLFSVDNAHAEVYSIQHYVRKFVSDLRQIVGFLRVLRFLPPIKLTTTIWVKYCRKWP
jgi:hypothetical protein